MNFKPSNSANSVFGNKTCVKFIKKFYDDMKLALPGLMAYRYQTQMFGECLNSLGKLINDYEDKENTIVAKAIPVMDI